MFNVCQLQTFAPSSMKTSETKVRIMTDTGTVLHGSCKHDQVNHLESEYGRDEKGLCISTNTVEGFFSLLKRGITGTYHHVGKQHLRRYLSEFDFRDNTRKITVGQRVITLIGADR